MISCYLHTYGNCSSDTLGGVTYILDLMTLYIKHDKNSMYAGLTKANTGRYSTRVRLTNEELSFVDKFSYLGHVMTADCRDDQDIKNRFGTQNAVGNMLVRKVSFAPMETKFQLFKLYCCPVYGQVLQYICFTTLSENLLSAIVTHSNDLLMYTSSSLAFVSNTNDHINVVFCRSAYGLMSRVTTSYPPQLYCYCHCQ